VLLPKEATTACWAGRPIDAHYIRSLQLGWIFRKN